MRFRACLSTLWIVVCLTFVLTPLPAAQTDDEAQAREALWLTDRAKLKQKIQTLVIGDVDLKDVTANQALDFLRKRSKLADPDHQGINFVFPKGDQPEYKEFKFNVNLKNATVLQVLQEVLHQFHGMLRPYFGDFVVTLDSDNGDGAYTRTFTVRDNLLAINPSMLIDKDKQIYDVRPLFQAKGIRFPGGASAVYALPAKTLTVVLPGPEEIIRVDEILVFGFKDAK